MTSEIVEIDDVAQQIIIGAVTWVCVLVALGVLAVTGGVYLLLHFLSRVRQAAATNS